MNFISKYKIPALIAVAMFSLTSCLKDKGFENGTYGLNGIGVGSTFVTIPQAGSNPVPLSLESKNAVQDLSLFAVNYEAADKAPEDVVVTVVKDDAAVSTVSGLTLLPASVLTLPSSMTMTVAKGQRVSASNFACKINTGTLDPTKAYGVAFTISAVNKSGVVIAQNLKTVIYKISLKNMWDGVYSVVSGTVTRYTNPTTPAGDALSGSLAGNPDVYLITTGPTELTIPVAGQTGALQWAYGNNSSVAGVDGIRITVDASNNTTSMSLGNATFGNWAGKENKYDPATKTFKLAFRWNPASTVREYEVVLKYKKSR